MTTSKKFFFVYTFMFFSLWSFAMFIWGQQVYKNGYGVNFETARGAADTVAYINNTRDSFHLAPLKENKILDAVAKIKACDMRDRNYFDHLTPEGQRTWPLFLEQGYNYLFAGENIAQGQVSDADAMQDLLNSPTHRANILSQNYTEVGVAVCGKYYVQEYGQPK